MIYTWDALCARLVTFPIPYSAMAFRTTQELAAYVAGLDEVQCSTIGNSREQKELYGLRFGRGSRNVSIVAGAHADEPAGPITAQVLPAVLRKSFPELWASFRFHVVPQLNPDGAARNHAWFGDPPSFVQYATQSVREAPGDDIEFGFGKRLTVRPECRAARAFLTESAPYAAHFSLHGMAFAEGAWFLICNEWAPRSQDIRTQLTELCARLQFPLHDIDRHGEKGFTRIDKGFCTSPTSAAMRNHFLRRMDIVTASRFMPSSMEMVQSFGGNPICAVTEAPMFLMGTPSSSLDDSLCAHLREDLDALRAQSRTNNDAAVQGLVDKYRLSPVSLAMQVRLQITLIAVILNQI